MHIEIILQCNLELINLCHTFITIKRSQINERAKKTAAEPKHVPMLKAES